ncbi:MAG: PQQ-binding-like beta-propeller repeat protein [Pirellulales bacterium]
MAWAVLLLAAIWPPYSAASAGEWPQILGPHRNGVADEERIATKWPGGQPPTLWQRDVGSGFAGVAVAGQRVVLFHRVGNEEIAEAMRPDNGHVLWKQSFPARYAGGIDPDNGPRCVPVIANDRVYLLGANGDLHCVSLESGQPLWSRPLNHELEARPNYFGAGSSPLVEGDRVLVNVGGRDGAGIVALDAQTGKTLWSATDEGASYSSPVAATIDGVRHIIFATRLTCTSVDPRDGSMHFQFPFGRTGPTVNGANPVVLDRHLFLSASYGVGAKLAEITANDARVVWESDDVMSSQYVTAVPHEGILYGIDGRQDIGVARLRAVDPVPGNVLWTHEDFGTAALILADGKLLAMKSDGELVIVEPSAQRYRELARMRLFDETVRALPALSGGKLYVRSTDTLKCIDLSK